MIEKFNGKSNVTAEDIANNPALAFLEAAPQTFTPTGSRLFGLHRPDSDYDFYVQNDEYIAEFLRNNGFTSKTGTQYYDVSNIFQVLHRDNVDVLLVCDKQMEDIVQEAVMGQLWGWDKGTGQRTEKYTLIPKEQRCIVWEVGYAVVRNIRRLLRGGN